MFISISIKPAIEYKPQLIIFKQNELLPAKSNNNNNNQNRSPVAS